MKYQDKESICSMLDVVRIGLGAVRVVFNNESAGALFDKYADIISEALHYIKEKTIEVEDAHR